MPEGFTLERDSKGTYGLQLVQFGDFWGGQLTFEKPLSLVCDFKGKNNLIFRCKNPTTSEVVFETMLFQTSTETYDGLTSLKSKLTGVYHWVQDYKESFADGECTIK